MKTVPHYSEIEALDSVTWYNGLAETVFEWRLLEPDRHVIKCPTRYGLKEPCEWAEQQLQVIWMIAVEMFGSCGTSPRYGWIEDIDKFRQFCLDITALWRGSEEYTVPKELFCGDDYIWEYIIKNKEATD